MFDQSILQLKKDCSIKDYYIISTIDIEIQTYEYLSDNYINFASSLATHFFNLSQFTSAQGPIPKMKMEVESANKICQNKAAQNRWTIHGFGSDEFWDIIEQVKDNFSNGFLNGLEQTLKDVVFWIMSWKIWEVYNVRDWIRHLLTLVEKSIRMLEKLYLKIFHHQWIPIFIQSHIAFLKIPVHLQTLADFVQSRNRMLKKSPPQEPIEVILNSESEQESTEAELNSETQLTNLATVILPHVFKDHNIWSLFLSQNGLEGLHGTPKIQILNGGYRALTVGVSAELAAKINNFGGKAPLESYTVTVHCRKIITGDFF